MSDRAGALRYFAKIKNGATPASGEPEYWDGDVRWATPEDLGKVIGRKIRDTKRKVTDRAVADKNLNVISSNSLLMSTRAPIGHMAITDEAMAFNQGCRAIVPEDGLDVSYAYFLLKSRVEELNASANGTTFVELSRDELAAVRIAPPAIEIQRKIARYLEGKSAQIDAVIEKKNSLLEELTERRQALVTNAVTKGLDASTRMKDSGVDWLGQIPAHWDIKPFKRAVLYQEGPGIMAVDFRDEGIPLLRIASIGKRYATLDGVNYLAPEMVAAKWRHFRTCIGDLLISASATSGIVSEVCEETAGAIPYTGIIRLNPIEGTTTSGYVRNFVVSKVFLAQIDRFKAGSTIQHFGPYHLGQMFIPVPPEAEQESIVSKLEKDIERIEELASNVNESVRVLSEYRAALITAAVTGKIVGLQ